MSLVASGTKPEPEPEPEQMGAWGKGSATLRAV